MADQYLFGTYKYRGEEKRVVRVKSQDVPDLPTGVYLMTSEESDDMVVTYEFMVGKCIKRGEDAEGNRYAWYELVEYLRVIDRQPGVDIALADVGDSIAEVESAVCDLDEATDERITAIEDYILDMDIENNGGAE